MGKYYGTMNISRNMDVSCYSKGCGHSLDMWNIMAHRYKWSVNDYIITASYCDAETWTFVGGKWELVLKDPECGEMVFGRDEIKNKYVAWIDKMNEDVNDQRPEKISCGIEDIVYGESYKNQSDHYPEFDENNACIHCKYNFNAEHIEEDKKKFNKVFFCA